MPAWPRNRSRPVVRRRRPARSRLVAQTLLLGDDCPALVGALLRAVDLHPALPLAAVLPRAAVVRAGAGSMPFALVDSGAFHFFAACLGYFSFACVANRRREHRANRRGYQRTLHCILHRLLSL